MGIFRRHPAGRRDSPAEDGKDDHLPFLSRTQADRIRALFRQAMAERGRETTIFGGHIQGDGPSYFGLWNVAVACREDPRGERAWPQIIARHADIVAAAASTSIDDQLAGSTAEQLVGRVYAHIAPASVLGGSRPLPRYTREITPGLVEMLVLDQPKAVAFLGDTHIDRLGGVAAARGTGLASIRALPPVSVRHAGDPAAGHCQYILENSLYTADRVLALPHMLTQLTGGAAAPYGVLVCVPIRQMVMFHVVRDDTWLPSLRMMADLGYSRFGAGRHRISPDVFWCQEGSWQQLTFAGPDGSLAVRVEDEFAEAVEALRAQSLSERNPDAYSLASEGDKN
jgi:hypothetical protein